MLLLAGNSGLGTCQQPVPSPGDHLHPPNLQIQEGVKGRVSLLPTSWQGTILEHSAAACIDSLRPGFQATTGSAQGRALSSEISLHII